MNSPRRRSYSLQVDYQPMTSLNTFEMEAALLAASPSPLLGHPSQQGTAAGGSWSGEGGGSAASSSNSVPDLESLAVRLREVHLS